MLRVAPTDHANSKTNLTSVYATNNNKKKVLIQLLSLLFSRSSYLLFVAMDKVLLQLPFRTRLFLQNVIIKYSFRIVLNS
jgi:hypothetical protein